MSLSCPSRLEGNRWTVSRSKEVPGWGGDGSKVTWCCSILVNVRALTIIPWHSKCVRELVRKVVGSFLLSLAKWLWPFDYGSFSGVLCVNQFPFCPIVSCQTRTSVFLDVTLGMTEGSQTMEWQTQTKEETLCHVRRPCSEVPVGRSLGSSWWIVDSLVPDQWIGETRDQMSRYFTPIINMGGVRVVRNESVCMQFLFLQPGFFRVGRTK